MSVRRSMGSAGRFGALPRPLQVASVTLLLTLPALLLAWWPAATEWMAYDRARIAGGEIWRVVTCHWTHWSLDHLGWDLAAFAVLVVVCWRACATRLLPTLAVSSVLIPWAVWLAIPDMVEYRGLSGLDSSLFMLLAVTLLRREIVERQWKSALWFGLAILAFLAKVAFELVTGSTLFVESAAFIPVPLAHLVGGACGTLAAMWPRRKQGHSLFLEKGTGLRPSSVRKDVALSDW